MIAQNDKMVAINSALAVDITGQVCADSIGRRDLLRLRRPGRLHPRRARARAAGSRSSRCPRPPRTAQVSRIVDALADGSGVVTTRADVHYVVTEYGIAQLYGRSLRERARELIAVAHPDFRAQLESAARCRKLF